MQFSIREFFSLNRKSDYINQKFLIISKNYQKLKVTSLSGGYNKCYAADTMCSNIALLHPKRSLLCNAEATPTKHYTADATCSNIELLSPNLSLLRKTMRGATLACGCDVLDVATLDSERYSGSSILLASQTLHLSKVNTIILPGLAV